VIHTRVDIQTSLVIDHVTIFGMLKPEVKEFIDQYPANDIAWMYCDSSYKIVCFFFDDEKIATLFKLTFA